MTGDQVEYRLADGRPLAESSDVGRLPLDAFAKDTAATPAGSGPTPALLDGRRARKHPAGSALLTIVAGDDATAAAEPGRG